jgi:hypothetical protein
MNTNKRRFALIATTTAAVLVGSGIAVAYWTTTGAGTGSAGVGTSTAVTVTQTSTISGLVPGGPVSPIDFNIASTASGPQTISAVAISISSITGNTGTCTVSDFALVQPLFAATPIPANNDVDFSSGTGGDVVNTGASISMVNSASNQNGCKTAVVHLAYAAN